jgi:hypothetical protein
LRGRVESVGLENKLRSYEALLCADQAVPLSLYALYAPIRNVQMKPNLTLIVTSLVSILFMTFHLTQDTLHARVGGPEGGGSTLIAVPILVVWLYGTLMLAERRSGYIIMLIGSLLALSMPLFHVIGPRGIFSGEMAKYSGAFLFFWTFFVLAIAGMLSFILSLRGLWSLRRGNAR